MKLHGRRRIPVHSQQHFPVCMQRKSKKLMSYFHQHLHNSGENQESFVIIKFIYHRDGHAFESKSDLQEVKNMFAAMQSESSRGISLFFNDVNVYAPEKNGKLFYIKMIMDLNSLTISHPFSFFTIFISHRSNGLV